MSAERLRSRQLIARGNTSDIHEWTPGTVIKVLRPDIPRQWAAIEADITRRVHAAGIPCPATDGIVEVDGRIGVVLERIDGPTMWEVMKETPSGVPRLIDDLVSLQTELHATSVRGLPDLRRRLGSKIDEAVQITASERAAAQALLAVMPQDSVVCHGDVHPANVIVTDHGPVILDWYDAAIGHAMADFARSSLLMRPPEAKNTWLNGATPQLLERLHCAYLAELARRHLIDARAFAPWEAVVAVARMSEPVPTGDLLGIWERWRAEGPAAAGSMIERCRSRVDRQVEAS
jgi:aminoglycoside phosphotransferase (APT) family kinase protein